jgi:predicted DNA-binding protein
METVATSVRVAGDAITSLAELTKKLGKSKAQVIEIALKELE